MFNPHSLAQNAKAPKDTNPLGGTVIDGVSLTEYVMERKYDGIRILAYINAGAVEFYTRTATNKTGWYPEVEAALLDSFPDGTWLDGEMVVFNEDGSQSWGGAQSVNGASMAKARLRSHTVTYVIFDVLSTDINGTATDIRTLPFTARQNVIATYLPVGDKTIMPSPQYSVSILDAQEQYDTFLEEGYEGAMLKRKDSPYRSGARGHGWFKIKATDEADVIIMGFTDGKDSFANMVGAIIFGQYRDGELVERGQCSGMTMQVRKDITANPNQYLDRVISVTYMTVMPSGALRHPQWSRIRDDKPFEDCIWT